MGLIVTAGVFMVQLCLSRGPARVQLPKPRRKERAASRPAGLCEAAGRPFAFAVDLRHVGTARPPWSHGGGGGSGEFLEWGQK